MQLQTTNFSSEKHVSHRVRAAIELKHNFQMDSMLILKISPILTPWVAIFLIPSDIDSLFPSSFGITINVKMWVLGKSNAIRMLLEY